MPSHACAAAQHAGTAPCQAVPADLRPRTAQSLNAEPWCGYKGGASGSELTKSLRIAATSLVWATWQGCQVEEIIPQSTSSALREHEGQVSVGDARGGPTAGHVADGFWEQIDG